jgi:hypothetical protein
VSVDAHVLSSFLLFAASNLDPLFYVCGNTHLYLFIDRSTLKELKEKILTNCVVLEKEKLCARSDNYQAILNSVAQVNPLQSIFNCFSSF